MSYLRADPDKLRANVPTDMRELPAWLLWKEVKADKPADKPKKVPYYASGVKRHGKMDIPEDRAQLVTFVEVMAEYARDRERWCGPGVALGALPDGTVQSGIDLDNSVSDSGVLLPAAQSVVTAANGTYAEYSPSGTGVKLFGIGDIGTTKRDASGLEIYSRGRFFTVTGEKLTGDRLAPLGAAAAVARELFLKGGKSAQVTGFIEQGRNNALISFLGTCRARGADDDELEREAYQFNLTRCSPPLPESEIQSALTSARSWPRGFALTDLGNRDRLVAMKGEELRYLVGSGTGWHRWTGQRFEPDREGRVVVMMGDTARGIYQEAADQQDAVRSKRIADWAHASQSRGRIEAAIALAESHPQVVDLVERFDCDPMLVGLQNGVFDLGRREFRPARRDDRITKQLAVHYDPAARAPRWERFQSEIHAGDAAMVAFKQRAWGYTLSGDVSEQKFFVAWGDGENGKGTEQETFAALMGDYALAIEPETLMKKKAGQANAASSDIAEMRGARFIYTAELEDGQELAEKLVKRLTGQDTIRARFLYKERFSFRPCAKFWISTNHRPEIRGTDHAMWRRVLLIPYTVLFSGERKDPQLRQKLFEELPGIFNWACEGFYAWQAQTLSAPETVGRAVSEYRGDMDQVGAFLQECTRASPQHAVKASDVYQRYATWAKENGIRPALPARRFHEQMERGHQHHRVKRDTAMYPGLLLVAWTSANDEM